jgi:hypothetical protein
MDSDDRRTAENRRDGIDRYAAGSYCVEVFDPGNIRPANHQDPAAGGPPGVVPGFGNGARLALD